MNPMEIVITKLRTLGFFQFILPFMLTAAIFYGSLRKSKIFGEPDRNVVVNAVVSLVAAFMVWSYPIIVGVNVETGLAAFFAQGMIATVVIILGLVIAGMFIKEDLPSFLAERLKGSRTWSIILVAGILVSVAVLVTSGLISVIIPGFSLSGVGGGIGDIGEWIGAIAVLGLMLGSVAVIIYISSDRGGSKEKAA